MTPTTITLADIRAAAENLANRHNDTAACAAHQQAEIKAAIAPVVDRYRETLDTYAAAEAEAERQLIALLEAAPQLFAKPRSITVDGVSCGYRKAEDRLDWGDDAAVIARIRALRPELAPVLIRTAESLVIDALPQIEPADLIAFGIRTVTGADRTYVKVGDSDTEKLAKMLIAAASARQGEDDAAPATKGKAKASAKAGKAVA